MILLNKVQKIQNQKKFRMKRKKVLNLKKQILKQVILPVKQLQTLMQGHKKSDTEMLVTQKHIRKL